MELTTLIKRFSTTPFLFVGSGFSRRYYNLPDWGGLLRIFVKRLSDDEFAYNAYIHRAKNECPDVNESNLLPYIASLIEIDFNTRWFADPQFRQLDERYIEFVKQGHSPFKVEICQYISNNSNPNEEKRDELKLLKSISSKSLSGIITTNYDELLERETDGYKTYVGQEELIFSSIQGWAEIYKIHGSVSSPESIVITQRDYENFEENCPYLAAKLMTIFMEYPIIFMGYSISDHNVLMILKSLVKCLSDENLEKLQDRFIYVEWVEGQSEMDISTSFINIDSKTIRVTAIKTDNFSAIYQAISTKRSALPAKLIRLFKQEFYTYALTNQPSASIRVADINDQSVDDAELVMAIGKPSTFGLKGLSGMTSEEWYRNIVLHDIEFSSDEILEYACPILMKQNNKLPMRMLLSSAKNEYPQYETEWDKTYDDLLNATIKKYRKTKQFKKRSVQGMIDEFEGDFSKIVSYIPYLYEHEIDIDALEALLTDCFTKLGFYGGLSSPIKSNVNRLVRIYDYMRYKRK